MLSEISENLNTTLAATEVGRMLQLFKTSGVEIWNAPLTSGSYGIATLSIQPGVTRKNGREVMSVFSLASYKELFEKEKIKTIDFGIDFNTTVVSLRANAFYARTDNLIERRPITATEVTIRSNESFIT